MTHVSMMHISMMHVSMTHVSMMHISMMIVSMMHLYMSHLSMMYPQCTYPMQEACMHDAIHEHMIYVLKHMINVCTMHVCIMCVYDPYMYDALLNPWPRSLWCVYPSSISMIYDPWFDMCMVHHTSNLSRIPRIYPCKFVLAGVNFYRFNAKNWQFTVYFAAITQKIGNLLCILS